MPYTHHHTSHPRPRVHHTPRTHRTHTIHSSLSSFTTSYIHVLEYVFPRTTRRKKPHPSTSPLGPGRGLTSLSDPHHARVDVSFHRGDARATRDDDDAFVDHLARESARDGGTSTRKGEGDGAVFPKTRVRGGRGELDDVRMDADNEINNGRWTMFGLLVGMMTELATGVDFPDQIRLMISVLGLADVYE